MKYIRRLCENVFQIFHCTPKTGGEEGAEVQGHEPRIVGSQPPRGLWLAALPSNFSYTSVISLPFSILRPQHIRVIDSQNLARLMQVQRRSQSRTLLVGVNEPLQGVIHSRALNEDEINTMDGVLPSRVECSRYFCSGPEARGLTPPSTANLGLLADTMRRTRQLLT
jgi:hypothetical protein